MIHIGPRHQCPHCPKSFTQRSNLTRHVRIHTGVKPYSCMYCDKRFSDQGACRYVLLFKIMLTISMYLCLTDLMNEYTQKKNTVNARTVVKSSPNDKN